MNAVSNRRIKAAVFHPVPLLAAGVIHTLAADGNIDVVACEAGNCPDVDVLVTDQETALAFAGRHAQYCPMRARSRIAVIASSIRESEVRAALEAGVEGYLLAECRPDELVQCVRALHAGSRYLSAAAVRCVADSLCHERLTPREAVVLALMAEGLGNKAIANKLCIGLGTVKSHVVAILDKLSVSNRTQAVTVASARGLLSQQVGEPPHRQAVSAAPVVDFAELAQP